MDSFTLYRERIGESLTRRLADAIAQEIVTIEEAAVISQTILDKIDVVKDHTELISFIEELAHKWPLFGPILVAQQAEKIEEKEENAISEVSTLLKENKIEEAAAAAESATQQSVVADTPTQDTPSQNETTVTPEEVFTEAEPLPQSPETQSDSSFNEQNNQLPMDASTQDATIPVEDYNESSEAPDLAENSTPKEPVDIANPQPSSSDDQNLTISDSNTENPPSPTPSFEDVQSKQSTTTNEESPDTSTPINETAQESYDPTQSDQSYTNGGSI